MKKLMVFYDKRQTAKKNESFSPSAGKPALVLKDWLAQKLPIKIMPVKPLSDVALSLAHDPAYVKGVLNCTIPNGFGNTLPEVAKTLRWTTGSIVAATLHSLKTRQPTASLTSGFHHASYNSGGGFCSFQGLIIAARIALMSGAKKVGIIDLDMHSPSTPSYVEALGLEKQIVHYAFGDANVTSTNAEEWLAGLGTLIRKKFKGCDVILAQCSADPHVNDGLGGVLTTSQLKRRDRILFEACKKLKVGCCWNLAGGYQKPIERVLEIHANTIKECLRVFK